MSKTKIEIVSNVCAMIVMLAMMAALIWGGTLLQKLRGRHRTIHISQQALLELNMACSGNYQDLVVNDEYVYANCKENLKPVTVQNYIFK